MTPIDTTLIQVIASRCGVTVRQAEHTVQLLTEGATVPFISRYRKERTGGLDEVQVSAVKEQFERLSELEKSTGSHLGHNKAISSARQAAYKTKTGTTSSHPEPCP